jgi:hypothetical protein
MGFKSMRVVGFLSYGLALVSAAFMAYSAFVLPVEVSSGARTASQAFLLVFLLIGQLSTSASTIVERQADRLAQLESEVAALRAADET